MKWYSPTRVKVLTILAILFWGWFFAQIAFSATLRGNRESCLQLTDVIMQGGEARDSGVPWSVIEPTLKQAIDEARKNPDSFVRSDDDEKFVYKSMKLVWDSPDNPPLVIAAAVYSACLGK